MPWNALRVCTTSVRATGGLGAARQRPCALLAHPVGRGTLRGCLAHLPGLLPRALPRARPAAARRPRGAAPGPRAEQEGVLVRHAQRGGCHPRRGPCSTSSSARSVPGSLDASGATPSMSVLSSERKAHATPCKATQRLVEQCMPWALGSGFRSQKPGLGALDTVACHTRPCHGVATQRHAPQCTATQSQAKPSQATPRDSNGFQGLARVPQGPQGPPSPPIPRSPQTNPPIPENHPPAPPGPGPGSGRGAPDPGGKGGGGTEG